MFQVDQWTEDEVIAWITSLGLAGLFLSLSLSLSHSLKPLQSTWARSSQPYAIARTEQSLALTQSLPKLLQLNLCGARPEQSLALTRPLTKPLQLNLCRARTEQSLALTQPLTKPLQPNLCRAFGLVPLPQRNWQVLHFTGFTSTKVLHKNLYKGTSAGSFRFHNVTSREFYLL